jgi:tetratricopeptide (TPR) repeat protein
MLTKKSTSRPIRHQPPNATFTPEFYRALGENLSQQGRWEEALAAYTQALQLQPKFTEVINACGNLGNLLQQQQQYDLARRLEPVGWSERSELQLSPGNHPVVIMLEFASLTPTYTTTII